MKKIDARNKICLLNKLKRPGRTIISLCFLQCFFTLWRSRCCFCWLKLSWEIQAWLEKGNKQFYLLKYFLIDLKMVQLFFVNLFINTTFQFWWNLLGNYFTKSWEKASGFWDLFLFLESASVGLFAWMIPDLTIQNIIALLCRRSHFKEKQAVKLWWYH